jgi:hypothetical protein
MTMPSDDSDKTSPSEASQTSRSDLPAAARRALAEANERRRAQDQKPAAPVEANGRGGLDPVRYGDWEIKGIACDF